MEVPFIVPRTADKTAAQTPEIAFVGGGSAGRAGLAAARGIILHVILDVRTRPKVPFRPPPAEVGP